MGLFSNVTGEGRVIADVEATYAPIAVDDLAVSTTFVARREAVTDAGSDRAVGPILDAHRDGDQVVTVRFEAHLQGYRGWQWSVSVALVDPICPTVSEVVLLPGPDALVAPEWVPWDQRVQSGDLGVGDVLLTSADDERVVPGYLQSDDPAVEDVSHELGLGRPRVLSRIGRADATRRWHRGSFGPRDEMAVHAPAACATCAFYMPVAGSLGVGFGVCANELSPADGHVVDVAYGCGAHSEATVRRSALSRASETMIDELQLDIHPHQIPSHDDQSGDAPSREVPSHDGQSDGEKSGDATSRENPSHVGQSHDDQSGDAPPQDEVDSAARPAEPGSSDHH